MKLKKPKEAIGHKIRWCRWKDDEYFIPYEIISGYTKQMKGTKHDKNGSKEGVSYNIVRGITTGEIVDDYWYMLDYQEFKINNELFEI